MTRAMAKEQRLAVWRWIAEGDDGEKKGIGMK